MQPPPLPRRVALLGAGRAGHALADALRAGPAGVSVQGPLPRGAAPQEADIVLLCVPDSQISAAAEALVPGPLVGHVSGACGLQVLAPHEAFSLHPLMTLLGKGSSLQGAHAAVAGSTPRALVSAAQLARAAGMEAFELAAEDRPAYHAAASLASNLLLVLEDAAERLAASAGVPRAALVPLVQASVENWAHLGAERALTGPIARGDEATVDLQRTAVADRAPELIPLFDQLCAGARELAGAPTLAGAPGR